MQPSEEGPSFATKRPASKAVPGSLSLKLPEPHQIIINSPSPEGSPKGPRNLKQTAAKTPENVASSIAGGLSVSTSGGQLQVMSPLSPAYPTSDLGSSARSSICTANQKALLDSESRKQRGSSSDFTDPESETSKDLLLSPGLMMSPAPFSPFCEVAEHAGEFPVRWRKTSSIASTSNSSTYCMTPRSCDSSPLASARSGSATQKFHFTFDPSSPTFKHSKHSTSCFLLPPRSIEDALRERSSSDSEAVNILRHNLSAGNLCRAGLDKSSYSPDLASAFTPPIFGEGRGRPRHPRGVKKRFLERFLQDQSTLASQSDSGGSRSSCSSLTAALQSSAVLAGGEKGRWHSADMAVDGHRPSESIISSRSESLSSAVDLRHDSPNFLSTKKDHPTVAHPFPIRLSCSSMEIGASRIQALRADHIEHNKLRSTSSENVVPSIRGMESRYQPYYVKESRLTAPHMSMSTDSMNKQIQSPLLSPGVISTGTLPDSSSWGQPLLPRSPISDEMYFNWWLRHQVAMASQMWSSERQLDSQSSVTNPMFVPFQGTQDVARFSAHQPDDTKHFQHTHWLGPSSRTFATTPYPIGCSPYSTKSQQRSRSESDVAYICFCGQSFALHDRLAKHIASRHRNRSAIPSSPPAKAHTCTVCSRVFSRSDMLTRHMRLHTGIRPYACQSVAKCSLARIIFQLTSELTPVKNHTVARCAHIQRHGET